MPNESFLPPVNDASAASAVRSPRNQVDAPGKLDSLPSAAAAFGGGWLYVPGAAGVADTLKACLKNASDTYENLRPVLTSSDSFYGGRRNVLASSGNTTMTTAMSGAMMLLDGATVAYALPAVGASDVGVYFDFFTTVDATNATITAQSGDLLLGGVTITAETTPAVDAFHPDGVDDLIITMNGTTKGGLKGSFLRLTCLSATSWGVQGVLIGTASVVTPFS